MDSGMRTTSPGTPRRLMTCGDCGHHKCQWASINRGVYLCDDCVIIHRQLGRHYSQVKHLTQSRWEPPRSQMLTNLVTNGANKIWEHNLLDPITRSNKKYIQKPTYNDPISMKQNYIKAKYEQLAYMCKDEDASDDSNELSSQLFAAARTNELLTSLRLLAHGARPDWQNSDKQNNCSLHIAAAFNQGLQIELLSIYGANPATVNDEGKFPEDIAREKGHDHVYIRLLEIRFELSDRLSFYRFQKKPLHSKGQHFIPSSLLDLHGSTDGKEGLSRLPATRFQELCADVYDEVDRREFETVWVACVSGRRMSKSHLIPHLSIHPLFSAVRNQGRQKLACFKQPELFNLLNDVIHEIIRRSGYLDESSSPISNPNDDSDFDENIYDDVASLSVTENTKESDYEVAEINSTNEEDKLKIKQLQGLVESHEKHIRQLEEENTQFKKKITSQAQELEQLKRRRNASTQNRPMSMIPLPSRSVTDDVSSYDNSTSIYEPICTGVINSLKQLVRALHDQRLDKLESHTAEMSRCLSDLITLFQGNEGNEEMTKKLEDSRDQLQKNCANLPANPSLEDLQPLCTIAYETAALIRELFEPTES